MAGFNTPVIDTLPLKQRVDVLERIMAGESMRSVAESIGVSAMAVQRYKQHALSGLESTDARERALASPLRSRLESVYHRIERTCDEVEPKERAPLFNQLHKNLELLGRATGELRDESPAAAVSATLVHVLSIPRVGESTFPAIAPRASNGEIEAPSALQDKAPVNQPSSQSGARRPLPPRTTKYY